MSIITSLSPNQPSYHSSSSMEAKDIDKKTKCLNDIIEVLQEDEFERAKEIAQGYVDKDSSFYIRHDFFAKKLDTLLTETRNDYDQAEKLIVIGKILKVPDLAVLHAACLSKLENPKAAKQMLLDEQKKTKTDSPIETQISMALHNAVYSKLPKIARLFLDYLDYFLKTPEAFSEQKDTRDKV